MCSCGLFGNTKLRFNGLGFLLNLINICCRILGGSLVNERKIMKKSILVAAIALSINVLGISVASAVEAGQPAPQFTLPSLAQDKPTALDSFKGKVVYLDFWASWCAPCRTSFPILNKLHEKLKAQGFEVVAINVDEDKSNAEKFLKEIPVSFTVLRDATGEWADKQYAVESMPTSFIIDKQGVIQMVHKGFTSDDVAELEHKITELLAK